MGFGTGAYWAANSLWSAKKYITAPQYGAFNAVSRAFRPFQWGGLPSNMAQLVHLRTNIAYTQDDQSLYGYFFDAVIREEHTTTLRKTEHPIQTGANSTDHAFMLPAQLVLEIGMSDAMYELVTGQYSGTYETKSVAAYNALVALQESREPLTVTTRLKRYENMLIEQIHTPDDISTYYGLRATITMSQLITSEVSEETVSAREHVTKTTNRANVQPSEPDNTTTLRAVGQGIGIE